MSIIEVKNLSKKYEYYRKEPGVLGTLKAFVSREKLFADAVKNVSFSIEQGELVGFLGPNGAGKTTTLKMLSGILHPTSGEVKVLGHIPYKREKAYQKQFSLVMGQKNQLLKDLPALESFNLYKEIYEIPDGEFRKNLDELVNLFGIKEILDDEKELRLFATRSIQAITDISKGDILREGINFDILRPGNRSRGIEPRFLDIVNSKKSLKDIKKDEGITEYEYLLILLFCQHHYLLNLDESVNSLILL